MLTIALSKVKHKIQVITYLLYDPLYTYNLDMIDVYLHAAEFKCSYLIQGFQIIYRLIANYKMFYLNVILNCLILYNLRMSLCCELGDTSFRII